MVDPAEPRGARVHLPHGRWVLLADLKGHQAMSRPARSAHGQPGSGTSLHAFAGAGRMAAVVAAIAGRLDNGVIAALQRGRSPARVAAARAVSELGEPGVAAASLALTSVVAVRRQGWRAAAMPLVAIASGVAARRILSRAVARPRPPEALWLTEPEGFSLPSRHTTLAALTAGGCAACLGVTGAARHGAILVAAAGVGTSRVYLGVHWPTDVLAGWLFAEGWLHLAGACRRPARIG